MREGRTYSYLQRGRFTLNVGLIITFVVVLAGLFFMLYAFIRPFTHIHHDHSDVAHPPHLDGR